MCVRVADAAADVAAAIADVAVAAADVADVAAAIVVVDVVVVDAMTLLPTNKHSPLIIKIMRSSSSSLPFDTFSKLFFELC